ncbi:MAG: ATP-binding cassette domain-containing protein [Rhodobiaceae bacterium]
MAAIELQGVTKRWGTTTGVDNVSFNVESGSFAILLGPSGCGKSTTLRMIAGLEEVTEGRLRIGGRDGAQARATLRGPAPAGGPRPRHHRRKQYLSDGRAAVQS